MDGTTEEWLANSFGLRWHITVTTHNATAHLVVADSKLQLRWTGRPILHKSTGCWNHRAMPAHLSSSDWRLTLNGHQKQKLTCRIVITTWAYLPLLCFSLRTNQHQQQKRSAEQLTHSSYSNHVFLNNEGITCSGQCTKIIIIHLQIIIILISLGCSLGWPIYRVQPIYIHDTKTIGTVTKKERENVIREKWIIPIWHIGRDYVHRSIIPLLDMVFTKVIFMASSLYRGNKTLAWKA
jgi:hypothetical protein